MRVYTKGRITLCLLIGLAVFAISNPALISSIQQEVEMEKHDNFAMAYTPHDAILLDGNAEMIAQATAETWPGDGSEETPYEITGYSFYDQTHSVEIRNIDLHWTFTDNQIDGPYDGTVWCGMEISNSSNGYVANNDILGRFRGLWLIDIENVTITNNYVHDNLYHGIECVGYINGCLISENTMTRNEGSGVRILTAVDSEISRNTVTESDGSGIQVIGSATGCQITNNYVDDVTGIGIAAMDAISVDIMHNEFSNTDGDSIYILDSNDIEVYNNSMVDGGEDGMVFVGCEDGLIHNNSIVGSDNIGISVASGENSIFRFNHVEDTVEYGMKTAENAESMEITQNVFINTGGDCQVCDEGENNAYIHNYYDDWVTPDVNSDLIVDVPYAINGAAENEDPYPLADPDADPIIPEEITTTTNSTTSTDTSTDTGTDTGTTEGVQIPLEIAMVAGGIAVIILVGVFFVKKRA